jgi:hypothetical protein
MRRLAPLPALALLAASVPAAAEEARPAAVSVATTAVDVTAPPEKEGLRASPHATTLDLGEKAPAGATAPAPGVRPAQWATWKAAGTSVVVAFVRGAGDALTVHADANGDGRFDASETVVATPVPPQAGREGPPTWKLEPWSVGAAKANLLVSETPVGLSGRLSFQPSSSARAIAKPLAFAEGKPASVTKDPGLGAGTRWAVTRVGEKDVAVAIAREGDYGMRIAVDADANGQVADGELRTVKGKPSRRGTPSGPVETRVSWQTEPIRVEGLDVTVSVTDAKPDLRVAVTAPSLRKGTADVGGTTYSLFLVDGDFDGRFTGEDDWWWFGTPRGEPKDPRNRLSYASMFEATETAFGAGKAWRLASVSPDGTASVVPAPAPDVEAYLHRRGDRVNAKRWFPRFDLERPIFSEDHELGSGRPKAAKPATWHHLADLDAALALAKREGKPLLVDFEADWCVWCKRVDYYTYGDAEVAEWLSKFTLVKLNVEFDEKRSFDRFDFGGLPAIAAFDANGKPVRFTSTFPDPQTGKDAQRESGHIPGWSKPERFVVHLKNLHAAATKAR